MEKQFISPLAWGINTSGANPLEEKIPLNIPAFSAEH
jgi:hypothetical protein